MPGFEFTPDGIRELRDEPSLVSDVEEYSTTAAARSVDRFSDRLNDGASGQPREVVASTRFGARNFGLTAEGATASAAVAPPAPPATAASKPLAPRDVLRLARARLRELDKEIRRLERLTKEREELRRLVAAAGKPGGVVRSIHRSAG
jgi:hypothetical protein